MLDILCYVSLSCESYNITDAKVEFFSGIALCGRKVQNYKTTFGSPTPKLTLTQKEELTVRTLTTLIVLSAAVLCMGNAYGAIFVADNNLNAPTGNNVFSSLQSALNAAQVGDTVQVTPSPTVYGNITIDRRLTVYGGGLNPDKDRYLRSVVGTITFSSNTLFQTNASGTVISGLQAGAATFSGGALSNIVIERCWFYTGGRISRSSGSSVDSLRIRNCIIDINRETPLLNLTGGASNLVISNSIFYDFYSAGYGGISADNNTVISNNIFIATVNTDRRAFENITDCIVANNIFYGVKPTARVSALRNVFNNNLTFGTNANGLPPGGATGQDNIVNTDPSFENFPQSGSNSFSFGWDFNLKAGSPAISAGTDGTDIGMFGGSNPLDSWPHVLPSIPLIQVFNASSVVRQGGNLNVKVKARSN